MTSLMRRGDSEVRNPTKDWLYLNIVYLSQDGFHTIRKDNIIAITAVAANPVVPGSTPG
jgi:hypothetical protein